MGSGENGGRCDWEAAFDLELVKVPISTVRDFDLLFAFVFGNQPFKRAITNTLKYKYKWGKSL